MSLNFRPSGSSPLESTAGPSLKPMPMKGSILPRGAGSPFSSERYRVRKPPMTSKLSSAKPAGSILA